MPRPTLLRGSSETVVESIDRRALRRLAVSLEAALTAVDGGMGTRIVRERLESELRAAWDVLDGSPIARMERERTERF